MRSRSLAAALSAALVLTGGAIAGADEEAPALELSLLYKDPGGDATAFIIEEVTPTSEDTLDLSEGGIGFEHGTETVVFQLGVTDLTELPPSGALGKTYYVNFGYGSGSYYVAATDHAVEGVSFELGTFNEQGLRSGLTAAEVTGAFDYDGDTVTIELSAEAFVAAVPDAPRFAPGARISATDVLAQRYIGSDQVGGATPTADTAIARSFTIPEPPETETETAPSSDSDV